MEKLSFDARLTSLREKMETIDLSGIHARNELLEFKDMHASRIRILFNSLSAYIITGGFLVMMKGCVSSD